MCRNLYVIEYKWKCPPLYCPAPQAVRKYIYDEEDDEMNYITLHSRLPRNPIVPGQPIPLSVVNVDTVGNYSIKRSITRVCWVETACAALPYLSSIDDIKLAVSVLCVLS